MFLCFNIWKNNRFLLKYYPFLGARAVEPEPGEKNPAPAAAQKPNSGSSNAGDNVYVKNMILNKFLCKSYMLFKPSSKLPTIFNTSVDPEINCIFLLTSKNCIFLIY